MQDLLTSIVSLGGLFLVMGTVPDEPTNYLCADNMRLSVASSGEVAGSAAPGATIVGPLVDITLPQVPSANGGHSARDGIELWVKGKTAELTRAGIPATTCQAR